MLIAFGPGLKIKLKEVVTMSSLTNIYKVVFFSTGDIIYVYGTSFADAEKQVALYRANTGCNDPYPPETKSITQVISAHQLVPAS